MEGDKEFEAACLEAFLAAGGTKSQTLTTIYTRTWRDAFRAGASWVRRSVMNVEADAIHRLSGTPK